MQFAQLATFVATFILAVNALPTTQDSDHVGLEARAKKSPAVVTCFGVTCEPGQLCFDNGLGIGDCTFGSKNIG
ncbi:hypothetical protein PspLS_08913 [Pyricularia sp. CBS 133598]|nr:hypothetical protein PspLS_08913 [Pyricularia sp. CBS 133598]